MKAWKYGQAYSGKLWFQGGTFLLVMSLIAMIIIKNTETDFMAIASIVVIATQLIAMIVPVFFTERALKRKFE